MVKKQLSWGWAVATLATLAGCDVNVGDCERDDAGECVDLFPDEDAGARDRDAGATDGEADAAGDGGEGPGGDDGGETDGASPPLSLEPFCAELYAVATAWRYAFDGCCSQLSNEERNDVEESLQELLFYHWGAGEDAVGSCVTDYQALIDEERLRFDETKAGACAAAFAGQFEAPPETCPSAGFDLLGLRAATGHGASTIAQLRACQEALQGEVGAEQPCASHVECQGGLRCRPAPGDQRTCQLAVDDGASCRTSSECLDGYTCVGGGTAGRQCWPSDELLIAGSCSFSIECAEGYICDSTGEPHCAPVDAYDPDLVCAQL
jgi:hypothetical protein